MEPADLMKEAIEAARQGLSQGQSPFGCAISRGDQLLAVAHNTVLQSSDPTAHAEVNAVRAACRELGEIFLEEAIVATTCEPCPMCMAALHWARVAKVYYGATIADATAAGFNELPLPAVDLIRRGGGRIELYAELLALECRQLFDEFDASPRRRTY